jgi:hypothetical protein
MPLEVVAVAESLGLRLSAPPPADIVALAVPVLPPLPELAAWTARIHRPVIIGSTAADVAAEGLVLDRWGHVAAHHHPAQEANALVVHRLGSRLVGLLLGPDRYTPEKARALALMGADLVLGFGSEPTPYGPLWAFSQQNQFLTLAVAAAPVLYMTCEMSDDGSGALPVALDDGWGRAVLPWERRRQAMQTDPVLKALNPDAYLSHAWWGS